MNWEALEGIFAVISIVISVLAFGYSIKTDKEVKDYERKKLTLEMIDHLQDTSFNKLNRCTPKMIIEVSKKPQSQEYKDIVDAFARLEHFAAGYNAKIYDQDIVNSVLGNYLCNLYDKLTPVLEYNKKQTNNQKKYEFNEMHNNLLKHQVKNHSEVLPEQN